MNKFKKIMANIGICFAGLAVGLLIVLIFNVLSYKARIITASSIVGIAVLSLVAISVISSRQNKQVEKLLDILYKQLNPKLYIEETKKVLAHAKSSAYKKTLLMNLAVGYETDCRFDMAISTMQSINIKGNDKVLKAMYYCNLACFYAESGQTDSALHTYADGEKIIQKVSDKLPRANLYLTKGIIAFAEGEYKKSLSYLKSAKNIGFDEKQTSYYSEVYIAKNQKMLGNQKEAEAILSRILRRKTLPYISFAASDAI